MTDTTAQAMLDQFKVAINNLPPTLPEVKEEADGLLAELISKDNLAEKDVHDAMVRIGKKVYPHRRALDELLEEVGEGLSRQIVLDHVEENVKQKLESMLEGGTVEEIVKSDLFETEFTPEERYQIEDAILHAKDEIMDEVPDLVKEHQAEYDQLVKKWSAHQAQIESKIKELAELAQKDASWRAEIDDKVSVFEEGWSVVERDPRLVDVEKEIEYWRGTLGMEV
ncbi:hypothetical protein KJ910_02495 [Patescibacteria group bacterium]|nr:hypothetical protein [Patescibacteria group bacterium]MBU1906885.1 hypothetical protein [Patescibacteria group bacterium]